MCLYKFLLLNLYFDISLDGKRMWIWLRLNWKPNPRLKYFFWLFTRISTSCYRKSVDWNLSALFALDWKKNRKVLLHSNSQIFFGIVWNTERVWKIHNINSPKSKDIINLIVTFLNFQEYLFANYVEYHLSHVQFWI